MEEKKNHVIRLRSDIDRMLLPLRQERRTSGIPIISTSREPLLPLLNMVNCTRCDYALNALAYDGEDVTSPKKD